MAFWLFNVVPDGPPPAAARERALALLEAAIWEVGDDEPHRAALSAGDHALVYLAAPARVFIGRAELASPVQPLASGGLRPASPGVGRTGVRLAGVELWEPPVPMEAVLSRIDPASRAKADFDKGVVGITAHEFEAALAAAASR